MQKGQLIGRAAVFAVLMGLATASALAGTIGLAWDAAPGAAGYRVEVAELESGALTFVDLATEATTHELSVEDAVGYRVCLRARGSDGAVSSECSNEIVGWPAPRVEDARVVAAAIDAASGDVLLTLEVDGTNFHPAGGVRIGDPAVGLVEQFRSSSTRIEAVLAVAPGTTRIEALALDVFNAHPLDQACSPNGSGCPTASLGLALEVDAVVNGLFSTATNLSTTSGMLFHYAPYVVPAAGEAPVAATPTFLPWTVGLTALDLEPDGSLLFGVNSATTIGPPLLSLQRSAIYRREVSGAIAVAHDFATDGPGLSGVAAAARLDDGRWLFVPTQTSTVIVDGMARTLAPSSVYRFDPQSGAVDELFAGGPLGTGPLDAVDLLDDGRLAISTTSHPFVVQGGALVRLWGMNAYAVASGSGTLETLLDGVALGLTNLDALSLGASVNASVSIVEDVVEPPSDAPPRFSTGSNGYAAWGPYFHRRVYEPSADGASAVAVVPDVLPWQIGIDALDQRLDGSFLFSVGPGGAVATESGVLTLSPGRVYRMTNSGTIGPIDGGVGEALGLDDIDALHVRADGSVWFSTAGHEWVSLGGVTQQLLHWRVYAWREGATTLEVVLDLKPRGVNDLDAVHGLGDGRVVFSTQTSPFVPAPTGLQRLWSMNAWVWDPETDSIELWLDGSAVGVNDLDAVTLDP